MVTLKGLGAGDEINFKPVGKIKYLFTTRSCPNCKLAKEYLKNEKVVMIDAEENVELTRKYGVMQAPTLIVVDGDSYTRYANASNIKKYAEKNSMVLA